MKSSRVVGGKRGEARRDLYAIVDEKLSSVYRLVGAVRM